MSYGIEPTPLRGKLGNPIIIIACTYESEGRKSVRVMIGKGSFIEIPKQGIFFDRAQFKNWAWVDQRAKDSVYQW